MTDRPVGSILQAGEVLGAQGGSGKGSDHHYKTHLHIMAPPAVTVAFVYAQVSTTCLLGAPDRSFAARP